ncbi:MAG: cytochrome c oxidase subunit II [Chthoniobacterales bacterium]
MAMIASCLFAGASPRLALQVLDPQSPQARSIYHLGITAGIIFALIFAIVAAMIVFALMRYRWREGEPDPEQVAGNRIVEIVWTVIPCLIVVALFILSSRTMGVADPPPPPAPDMVVTGHQWWWEARYPKSGVVTANEIHIPAGRPFSIQLKSADVLHEFWVPELARKEATVPGHPNHIWIEADHPGNYLGVCSEFCGTQHAWMHFLVVAQSAEDFAAWEKAQLQPTAQRPNETALRGRTLFQQLSCMNCHAIAGTAANAGVGTNLTHFASRRQLGAGIVENTPANLRRWLTDPQQVKPGVKMPDFKFNQAQVNDLAAYLETLK